MGNEWRSYTYGQLNIEEIPRKLLEFYERNLDSGEPLLIVLNLSINLAVCLIAI